MEQILGFLSKNPILAICICLSLGYCIGCIKMKNFSFGPTIGTLMVGFVLSRFVTFEIPSVLVTLFSLLFCFTIGYEAGPAFFKSLKSNGIKFILQAVFFCSCAFVCLYLLGVCKVIDKDIIIGIAAGALTQTSILTVAEGLGDMASVSYAVTYMTGTLFAILFASVIGPRLMGTTPILAVKHKLTKASSQVTKNDADNIRLAPLFPRAFCVDASSKHIGKTVEELEDLFAHTLEVVKYFRNKEEIKVQQDTVIQKDDVLTIISPVQHMVMLDDEYLHEVCDKKYLSVEISQKEIMITENSADSLIDLFSSHGIVVQSVTSKSGKKLNIIDDLTPTEGMSVKVSGTESAIRKIANKLGYVKEIGSVTDVPFVFTAIAAAVIFGALKFCGFGLGDSTCALVFGLVCGWFYNKNPRYGQFPESARWFLKSVGLNIFIAVKALTTGFFAFDSKLLMILGIGIGVTLIPHIITLFFCRYILKMDEADVLGGQCGSGTCTAALNSLIDSSGSSVFTASYATTNAISNILLTVLGVLLSSFL